MTEAAFIAACEAAPNDWYPRLLFADWPDEHGDPRAELIRTIHDAGMRPTSVYTESGLQFVIHLNRVTLAGRALAAFGRAGVKVSPRVRRAKENLTAGVRRKQ